MRTRVGYTGGTTENPTYNNLGDHTETIQVDFDPTLISYEELLDHFWSAHDPNVPDWSRQYMSAIFYGDESQKRLAFAYRARLEAKLGGGVDTQILPLKTFYLAEDYHQKFDLRGNQTLLSEMLSIYPDPAALRDSTTAARINGYLGGHGTQEQFLADLGLLGLSARSQELLKAWFLSILRQDSAACPIPPDNIGE